MVNKQSTTTLEDGNNNIAIIKKGSIEVTKTLQVIKNHCDNKEFYSDESSSGSDESSSGEESVVKEQSNKKRNSKSSSKDSSISEDSSIFDADSDGESGDLDMSSFCFSNSIKLRNLPELHLISSLRGRVNKLTNDEHDDGSENIADGYMAENKTPSHNLTDYKLQSFKKPRFF